MMRTLTFRVLSLVFRKPLCLCVADHPIVTYMIYNTGTFNHECMQVIQLNDLRFEEKSIAT